MQRGQTDLNAHRGVFDTADDRNPAKQEKMRLSPDFCPLCVSLALFVSVMKRSEITQGRSPIVQLSKLHLCVYSLNL
jgi:hypothetical protein